MSDLIKREDAINLCGKWRNRTNEHHDKNGWYIADTLLKAIKELPSADSPQEWIPCSVRLPKKEEATYLICTETGHMCSCRWTNNMYGLGSNEWSKWGWHIMDKPQYAKVVAWMPLKPWKGADDD